MIDDPIVNEIRKIRQTYAEKFECSWPTRRRSDCVTSMSAWIEGSNCSIPNCVGLCRRPAFFRVNRRVHAWSVLGIMATEVLA